MTLDQAVDAVGEPVFGDRAPGDEEPPAALVPDMWFTVALEEYRSLRIEIVDAISAQRRIMQVGVAGMAVLVGFGLQPINRIAAVIVLGGVVPAVALFVTIGALGELVRAVRASAFLHQREAEIDRMVGVRRPPAMEWEHWLRRGRTISRRDGAEFGVVMVVATGAAAVGAFLGAVPPAQVRVEVVGSTAVVSALLILGSVAVFLVQIAEAKVLFTGTGGDQANAGSSSGPGADQ